MLASQEHISSLIEYVQHILFAVLAREAQQHSRIHLINHELLQSAVSLGDCDSLRTLFATYAFPNSVITVQHNDFEGLSLQVEDGSKQGGADGGEALRCVRNIPQLMAMNVVILGDWVAPQQGLRTDGGNARPSTRP